jgi:membrane protease YdiL (CAAX protease family)
MSEFDLTFIDLLIIMGSIAGLEITCLVFTRFFYIEAYKNGLLFVYCASLMNIIVPIYYAKTKNKNYWNQLIDLDKPNRNWRNALIGILSGLSLVTLVRLIPYWEVLYPAGYEAPLLKYGWWSFLLFPISTLGFQLIVLGPIGEEIIHRALIYNWFKKRMSLWFALLAQAVVFGVIHFSITSHHRFYDFLYYSIGGLVLGFLYEKTKTLITPIVCHGMVNFLMVVFSACWK